METQGLCDPPPTGSQPVLGPGPQFKERLSNLNLGPCPPELPAPRSLSFSEVGSRSFRATWETDTPSVESYLVQFRPADDTDGHFVSVSVPGDTLTSVLPHLTPETRYEVNVLAQYDKGESFPVTGYEKTLEGQLVSRCLGLGSRTSADVTGPHEMISITWMDRL